MLDASRRYDFAITAKEEGGYCFEQVLDSEGAVVAEAPVTYERPTVIRDFRPARSGKRYLRVDREIAEDLGAAYRVVVTRW